MGIQRRIKQFYRDIVLNAFSSSSIVPFRVRLLCMRIYGISIGKGACVAPQCFFGGNNIVIKDNVFINYQCYFDNNARITIDENVQLGMRVLIATSNHSTDDENKRAGMPLAQEVHVKRGAWIAAGATILPGVTIGEGSVIAAGSVVTKDTESNCLYAGNPAKKNTTIINI